jgi:AcrR family transcriptional regulator
MGHQTEGHGHRQEEHGVSGRQRQRTGGRSEQVREAVGRAVLDLLAEGRVDFTTVELAERAEVSRQTVYRWWPTYEDLLAEALGQHARRIEVPDTGRWDSDVRLFAHRVAAFAAEPVELAMASIMASGRAPDFNRAVIEHFSPVTSAWWEMVERAVERGEADPAHAPRAVLNVLMAPLFLGPLMNGHAVPEHEVDQVVDLVLAATLTSTTGDPPTS